jgi:DNA-binding CsgD family transcriptional regulator
VDVRELSEETLAKGILQAAYRISERALPRLIITDRDCRIVLTPQTLRNDPVSAELVDLEAKRLQPAIDKVVREIVASWSDAAHRAQKRFGIVPPRYIVRVIPLSDETQCYMAVLIEHIRHRDSLSQAARGYSLSPRETEVLSLILEGASAPEIASLLCLAESTVQSYFKHLLSKTNSRNRPSMVAKVLGWDGIAAASATEYAADLLPPSGLRDPWDELRFNGAQRPPSPLTS